ncbi:MAG TPA: hypothetical protein VGG33_24455 [Polyangia bacterium]
MESVSEVLQRIVAGYAGIGLGVRAAIIIVLAILTTAGGIWLVVRLPCDHFNHRPPSEAALRRHPIIRFVLVVVRNILGIVILPIGIVMSLPLVPGPGLVLVLLGLSLLDFPGKRAIQRRLVTQPMVMRVLNKMRTRFGKPPFEVDPA